MRRARPLRSRVVVPVALVALIAAACSSDEGPRIEVAQVRAGEVIETVAAPARLTAAASVRIDAPTAGEVVELLVTDGDAVEAGDVLVRLTSPAVDAQLEQAAAAAEAAASLGALAGGVGVDLAPAIGAFRGQLDAVGPGVVDAVGAQLDATATGLAVADSILAQVAAASEALADLPDRLAAELGGLPVPDALRDLEGLDDVASAQQALAEADADLAAARRRLDALDASFRQASRELQIVERDAARQASRTAELQATQVAAQLEQATAILSVAQDAAEALTITAPIRGVVELSRGDDTAGGAGVLPGGLGALGGGLGALGGGLGALAGGSTTTGPLRVGSEVRAGQLLLHVYDLTSFEADADVDELDVVRLARGQRAEVRVEAFPGVVLEGSVAHIAVAAGQQVTGGVSYRTVVRLVVPPELALRVGLTATAEIEVARVESDTVVPSSALLRRGEGEVVQVVRDGVAVEVPVVVRAIGDQDAAVEGELQAGEQVVTVGVELIESGDAVPS